MLHGQDLMVTDEKRRTMNNRCWHMPHSASASLRAWRHRGLEQPRKNLNPVYTQVNEYIFLLPTLRPLRRGPQECRGTKQRRSLSTFTGSSACGFDFAGLLPP